MLAWTTTPWTLPSNLALAVGPEIEYVLVEALNARWILSSDCLDKYSEQLPNYKIIQTLTGSSLVGLSYEPIFDFFADRDDAFRVLPADFVDTSEGTGVVHMAPGFGEDDQLVCEANEIEIRDAVL